MTANKLTMIKDALAALEAALKFTAQYSASNPNYVYVPSEYMDPLRDAHKHLHDNASDYLKALLPVVEAAVELANDVDSFRFDKYWCNSCGQECFDNEDAEGHTEDCKYKQLLDKLAELNREPR